MQWLSAEQSNTSLIVGDVAMLKMFRRVAGGPHPEAEMGRYLTEHGFANIAPLLGEVVRVDADGDAPRAGVAQGFVRNQGDAWTWTLDLLTRGLSELTAETRGRRRREAEHHEDYDAIATLLGRRLGEMHAVLARRHRRSGFAPETRDRRRRRVHWAEQARAAACRRRSPRSLRRASGTTRPRRNCAIVTAGARGAARERCASWPSAGDGATLTRIHGDFHLGQVLVANGDVYIIDFEGEPAKPLDAAAGKNHPLRDVAGLLRSFDYAAAVVEAQERRDARRMSPDAAARCVPRTLRASAQRNAFLAGYRGGDRRQRGRRARSSESAATSS